MRVVIDSWAWLPKDQLSKQAIDKLKSKLTFHPKKVGNYPGPDPDPVLLYRDLPTQFGVARQFFMSRKTGEHELVYRLADGSSAAGDYPEFSGTLYPDQSSSVDTLVSSYKNGDLGGILKAGTGVGKTTMALAFLQRLNKPALILVHKDLLMNQWQERINQFLPGAKVGFIQQDVCDYEGKHIVLGMMQTLARREVSDELRNYFGILGVDEAHHAAAESFSTIPGKFNARYRFGLSATLKRADGMEDVFYNIIGPVVSEIKATRLVPSIRRVWTDFKLIKTERLNPANINRALIIRFLCASTARNKLIVGQLLQAASAGRKILVLSERIKHLHTLAQLLSEETKEVNPRPTIGFAVGGMDSDTLARNCEAQIIFGTMQMVAEAFDHPPIDTIFLTTPSSNVEQGIGRALRLHPGKKDPIVVDFRDDKVPQLMRAGMNRDKTYAKLKGK